MTAITRSRVGRTSRFPAWMPTTERVLDVTYPGRFQLVPRHLSRPVSWVNASTDEQLEAAVILALDTSAITFDRRSGRVSQEGRLLMEVTRIGDAAPADVMEISHQAAPRSDS